MTAKFKMIGRDINSQVVQYRSWVVDDEPDFEAEQYDGPKSGDNDLTDIEAYLIPDDIVANFTLPTPESWDISRKQLPNSLYNSQLAVLDGYIYLFGGTSSNKILRASTIDPTNWSDTGSTLPDRIHGSQLGIVDGYIYLFGGGIDGYSISNIYKATTNDPLTWTDTGSKLPDPLTYSQIAIMDDVIYLFGGKCNGQVLDSIYRAQTTNPLVWQNIGETPEPLYGSQLCIKDGYTYLIGGMSSSEQRLNTVYRTSSAAPIDHWYLSNYLPFGVAFGQVAVIGNAVYYMGGDGYETSVFAAKASDPSLTFRNLGSKIPSTMTHQQLMIIDDKIYLLAGNGNTMIYACENKLKYNLNDAQMEVYGQITRTDYEAASILDLFETVGMRPWCTNYGS